jgi:hypothetical protein
MSRTIRLAILVTAASVLGACTQNPTAPTEPSQPTTAAVKAAPVKANADDECDWTRPWTC